MLNVSIWSWLGLHFENNLVGWNGRHQRPAVVPVDIDLRPIAVRMDAGNRSPLANGYGIPIVDHAHQPHAIADLPLRFGIFAKHALVELPESVSDAEVRSQSDVLGNK